MAAAVTSYMGSGANPEGSAAQGVEGGGLLNQAESMLGGLFSKKETA
jgi:hypothetical protein